MQDVPIRDRVVIQRSPTKLDAVAPGGTDCPPAVPPEKLGMGARDVGVGKDHMLVCGTTDGHLRLIAKNPFLLRAGPPAIQELKKKKRSGHGSVARLSVGDERLRVAHGSRWQPKKTAHPVPSL